VDSAQPREMTENKREVWREVMFGFIHRLCVIHSEDEKNDLTWLQLCFHYSELGVFKAGKSYMIRDATKRGCISKLQQLCLSEKIIPNINNPAPYSITYGHYTKGLLKKDFCRHLSIYVSSLAKPDDARYYITDVDKEIEYLTLKLSQLRPDYKSSLPAKLLFL
jgi:hypothetical protein